MAEQRARSGDPYRIGVLSLHNSKETKAILNAIAELGHEPVWLREANLTASIDDVVVDFDPEIDVVLNRLLLTKVEQPLEDLGLAWLFDDVRPVLNPPKAVMGSMHKFGAATTLAAAGIPVPDAYLGLTEQTLSDGRTRFQPQAVRKPAVGTNGTGVSLVDTDTPVGASVGRRRAFLQEFLASETRRPSDVRVYVVDGAVVGAMRRYAPPGEWRTNVALGGDVEAVTGTLPRTAKQLAVRATTALDLDYAGVDLIRSEDGWSVLEVNATAGFRGLFEATGVSPAARIAQVGIERVGGEVEDEKVAELAGSLDDSVPECKPDPSSSPDASPMVGFTERVSLSGSDGLETVIGKADTGARRTSIDVEVAAAIGTGPITGTTAVKSATRDTPQTRPLVELAVGIDDQWHTVTASIDDRSHMEYPVLIGRDILRHYRIDVNRRVDEEE